MVEYTKKQLKKAMREEAARYPKRPEQSYPEFKPRRILKHPNLVRDVEEVRRLMKRPPTAEITNGAFCVVCRSNDHVHFYCPCLVKIEDGVVLGPYHDSACIGCGKIGEICCSRGAYAVPKFCAGCTGRHWYWERKCSRANIKKWAVKLPSIDGVQLPPSPHENYVSESDDEVVYLSSTDEEMSSDDEDKEVSFATAKDDLQGVDTLIPSQKVSTKDKDSDENYMSDEDVAYLSTTDGEMSSDDEDEEVPFPTVKDDLQKKGKDKLIPSLMASITDGATFEAKRKRWAEFKAHGGSRRNLFKTKMELSQTKETDPKKISRVAKLSLHDEETDPKKISRPAKNSEF